MKVFFKVFFVLVLIFNQGVSAQLVKAFNLEDALRNKASLRMLDLSNQDVSNELDVLLQLSSLEELNLMGTNLTNLPKGLTGLKLLKKINLSYNESLDVEQVFTVLQEMNLSSISLEGCKLPFLPYQLAKIKTLSTLNISNNYISDLPDNFSELTGLVELNLAMNYLDSIHAGLNTLPNLEILDLSFNTNVVIDHLINSKLDFPKLQEVKLVGVNNFPKTLNLRNGKLAKLDLSETSFKKIEQLSTDSFKVDHIIANDCKKLNYEFACKTLQNSGVKKLEISSSELERLPTGVQRMKELEELNIAESKINYLTSLNNHKNLHRITINSDELSTIFSSVSRLKSLEYLNIKDTDIKNEEVVKLVEHFPHAEIVYDSQKQGLPVVFPDFLRDFKMNIPFKNLLKPKELFKFSSKEKQVLTLASGTQVSLDENSFQLKNGTPYEGYVKFEVSEYKTSLDVYLSGLPMVYDSSALYGFESGGMYNLTAKTVGGKSLELKKDKPLVISTELPQNRNGFQSYELIGSVWVNNNLSPTFNAVSVVSGETEGTGWQEQLVSKPKKPRLDHEHFALELWETKEMKGYRVRFKRSNESPMRTVPVSSGKVSVNDLAVFRSEPWIVIDPLKEEKIERLKKASFVKKLDWFSPFSKKTVKYQFQDIQRIYLKPQVSKDNFLLTVVTKTGTFDLEIIQDFANVGPRSSKRKIKNQWKRYNRIIKKISYHNEPIYVRWEAEMKRYQIQQKRYYEDSVLIRTYPEAYYAMKKRAAEFRYRKSELMRNVFNSGQFGFSSLGMVNIDRIQMELTAKGREVFIDSYDENGDSLILESVSVLCSNLPAAFTYHTNRIYLLKTGSAILIGKTVKGDLAYVSKATMDSVTYNDKGNTKIKFTVVNPLEISTVDLEKLML